MVNLSIRILDDNTKTALDFDMDFACDVKKVDSLETEKAFCNQEILGNVFAANLKAWFMLPCHRNIVLRAYEAQRFTLTYQSHSKDTGSLLRQIRLIYL